MKVYLAVGHGMKSDGTFDPGAVHSATGETEHAIALEIVSTVQSLLNALGVNTLSEIAPHSDPNWPGSAAVANTWKASIAVEIHLDWEGGEQRLWPLIWHEGSTSGAIGHRICERAAHHGVPFRDPTVRRDLGFLRTTMMPSVLIECGRVGSEINDDVFLWSLAIAEGIYLAAGGDPRRLKEEELTQDDIDRIAQAVVSRLADVLERPKKPGVETSGRLRRALVAIVDEGQGEGSQ